MAERIDGPPQTAPVLGIRLVMDAIPAVAWQSHPDGTMEFANQRWHDYTGLSSEESYGSGWKAAIHPQDLNELLEKWGRVPDLDKPRECEVRLRGHNGAFRWFLLRREPLLEKSGAVAKWFVTGIDSEDGKQEELLRTAEKRTLKMIGDGASLFQILNELCAAIDEHTSAISLVFLKDGARNQLLPAAGPHLPPAVAAVFTPWPIGPNMGSCGTAAFTKERVIISDIATDSRWPHDARRLALDHGLYAAWSEPLISNCGEVLGTFGIAFSEPRPLNNRDLELMERAGHIARIAIERQRSQEALRTALETITNSETKVRQVIDAIPVLAWCNFADGPNEFLNKRWHDYTGLSHEESHGWGWQVAFHPEDLLPLMEKWRELLASGEAGEIEARLRRHDGIYRWFLIRVGPFRDESGRLVRWYGTSIDVDDRKRTEESLRLQVDILHHLPAVSWTALANGMQDFASQQCREYTGRSSPAAWMSTLHPDDREHALASYWEGFRSGKGFTFEARFRRASDGAYRWHLNRAVPVQDSSGNLLRLVGTSIDIEDLKRAEQAQRESEQSFRLIVDGIAGLVATMSAGGEVELVNRQVLEYFGKTLEDLKGWTTSDAVHPSDLPRAVAAWTHSVETGDPYDVDHRLRRSDGVYRWFHSRGLALRDSEGRVVRWYNLLTDIDERKKAEEKLQHENLALREEVDHASMFEEIIGTSPALQTVLSRISKVAPSDATILITGETGVGKELMARCIQRRSTRASRAFISVNCAAIPRDLILSELFGHEKGAFTGATQRRIGRFELADGGTIFLDEVCELSHDTQVALLRVLQEREFERVGSEQSVRVDVRVIAATNRDLKAAVANGTFREDLFYRLNVFPVLVPPLRERKKDILMLVEYFVQRYATKAGKTIRSIDKKTVDALQSYDWPGNIRELQNIIERSVILNSGDILSVDELWLSRETSRLPDPVEPLETSEAARRARIEREIIEQALAETKGRVSGPSGAAAKLRIPQSTLATRIKALKIDKRRFKYPAPTRG
jgi:PAS domain S-box-containing protein